MRMLQTSMGIGPKLLRRTLHRIGALCRGARKRVRTSASRSAPNSEGVDRRYRLLAALRAPSVVLWGTTTCVSERQHILTHPAYDLLEVRPWQALRHSLQASQELLFCFATSRCPRHDQADDLRPDGIIERHERWRADRAAVAIDHELQARLGAVQVGRRMVVSPRLVTNLCNRFLSYLVSQFSRCFTPCSKLHA